MSKSKTNLPVDQVVRFLVLGMQTYNVIVGLFSGKWQAAITFIFTLVPGIPSILADYRLAIDQFNDMDAEEAEQVKVQVSARFDIPEDEVEAKIEKVMHALIDISREGREIAQSAVTIYVKGKSLVDDLRTKERIPVKDLGSSLSRV